LYEKIRSERKKRMTHPQGPSLQNVFHGWIRALRQLEQFPQHHCPAHKPDEAMAELRLSLQPPLLKVDSILDLPVNLHPLLQTHLPQLLELDS
jgi:hypothetical protein